MDIGKGCSIGLAALFAITASAGACPLAQLVRISGEPIKSFRHEEMPLTHWQSTEGGKWDIYLRSDGTLHSLVRTDFGETGQRKLRVSFLTKDEFVIAATMIHYGTPIGPSHPTIVASSDRVDYFFCKDIVYIPVSLGEETSATHSLSEARRLKSDIIQSADIASYLRRVR